MNANGRVVVLAWQHQDGGRGDFDIFTSVHSTIERAYEKAKAIMQAKYADSDAAFTGFPDNASEFKSACEQGGVYVCYTGDDGEASDPALYFGMEEETIDGSPDGSNEEYRCTISLG